MSLVYRNRSIINQRGGAIDIDNTTEQEKIKISQRSGSNINFTNYVTSELATNNKQTNIVNDSFETVGGDKTSFIAGNKTNRVAKTSYNLKGFSSDSQLTAIQQWKDLYDVVAKKNSQFKIKRGGVGYPNGDTTDISGTRATNPVIGSSVYTVQNTFRGYSGVPIRRSDQDDVVTFSKVIYKDRLTPARARSVTKEDIESSAGLTGSNAPGVLEFGADSSPSTENGEWSTNTDAASINDAMLDIQDELLSIEQQMGDNGDDISTIKGNKIEQIGAVFNDYPSIRVDEKGRSQPLEMLVSPTGTYKNHDYAPHIEEVDNSSNFPGGNDDKIVGNKYSRLVGSGGIQLKTTGPTEMGGTTLKGGYKRINLNASHGLQIASEAFVEIQSLKSIILRTNRQVYVESALGVKGNVIVGGGISVEGETYLHHVTAPLEVQQTQDTITFGKFATDTEDTLQIGWAHIGGVKYPVTALPTDDLLVSYPHSHHFNNLPLRLTRSNSDVRKFAQAENVNTHNNIAQALSQKHERKLALEYDI